MRLLRCQVVEGGTVIFSNQAMTSHAVMMIVLVLLIVFRTSNLRLWPAVCCHLLQARCFSEVSPDVSAICAVLHRRSIDRPDYNSGPCMSRYNMQRGHV